MAEELSINHLPESARWLGQRPFTGLCRRLVERISPRYFRGLRALIPQLIRGPGGFVLLWRQAPRYRVLWDNYLYDMKRYVRLSTFSHQLKRKQQLLSRITADSHVLEKGLSFENPKVDFGQAVALRLLGRLENYRQRKFEVHDIQFQSALQALKEYRDFRGREPFSCRSHNEQLVTLLPLLRDSEEPAIREIKRDQYLKSAMGDFSELNRGRCSIRSFAKKSVPIETIQKAIEMAIRSPSVCNRQNSRVHILTSEKSKQAALACHVGSRGFGLFADKILVVCSDLGGFNHIGERNQAYIDGGLFSMTLMYGLQYQGLGCCPLNWSAPKERDLALREAISLPDEHSVIMLLAVGYLPDSLKTPRAARLTPEQITRIV